jgi:putative transposase
VIDLAQAQPGTVYLAEDEAWMYLQATTMAVWSPEGETPVARVDPGHTKVGFYGTLNLLTGEEMVTRTEGFNSQLTAAHLQSILDSLPDNPVVLFWDRAKWHRGQSVRELLAANPRLEIIEFPAGAPDLNPQEQVWKQSRRRISHNHLEPKLPALADRFEDHLRSNTFHSSFLDHYGFNIVCPFLN